LPLFGYLNKGHFARAAAGAKATVAKAATLRAPGLPYFTLAAAGAKAAAAKAATLRAPRPLLPFAPG
jgi:hypothetical protein